MSKLPEQKKSPQEIAALRDQLGVRPPASEQPQLPTPQPAAPADSPATPPRPHRQKAPAIRPRDIPEVPPAPIDQATGLPVKRHTRDELAALRLRSMFETQDGAQSMPVRRERTLFVIGGYLLAAAAIIPIARSMPAILPMALCFVALTYAAYLFIYRPYSRHHAAFIGILVLFVLVYAALQYFPHLRHAT
jgi:hypothetical protein